ncbi:MAG: aldo/keto reductase [Flavobacteriaceae bacterium]|nr:aldo/keto reductase [Flavobacteriaceae bacterium]
MKIRQKYSHIIAGTMTWGRWGKSLSTAEMEELLNYCLELGITTFDHADIYGGYTNEADFGKAFKASGISRDGIQLISKCGIQLDTDSRKNKVNHYQYDTDYIVRSVEQSLSHLQTEYLDLLLLHRPSPLMHPDPVSRAIEKLRKEGKIRDFGVSNFTPSQVGLIEKATKVQANQIECSLTQHKALFNGMLDDGITHDRMMMSWSPLGSYYRKKGKKKDRIKKVLKKLKKKYKVSTTELLLAWIMTHPAEIHPVVGTTTKERLALAVKAADLKLDNEDWFRLLIASQGHDVP